MALPVFPGQPEEQFYRRPLPKKCINFTSAEGRTIFKEALDNGHMACYFKLSAQFRTQDEPTYCGLTSLVMALNALEIDPGRVWKAPWRWYHENMLDCCVSLDEVKEKGISMEQLISLSKCNSLDAEHVGGMDFKSADDLRTLIKEKVQLDNEVVIVGFSRETFNQTGTGHFSPIAGFHEGLDLVLILDTARFKYPPYWVSLRLLLEAMQANDVETGLPRGMVILSKSNVYNNRTLLYSLSCSFVISTDKNGLPPVIWYFSNTWNSLLDESQDSDDTHPEMKILLGQFVQIVLNCLPNIPLFCLLVQSNSVCCNNNCEDMSTDEENSIRSVCINLIQSLESLLTFQLMKKITSSLPDEDRDQLMNLVTCCDIKCYPRAVISDTCYDRAVISDTCYDRAVISDTCYDRAVISDTCYDRAVISDTCYDRAVISDTCYDRAVISDTCYDRAVISDTCYDRAVISDMCYDRTVIDDTTCANNESYNRRVKRHNLHDAKNPIITITPENILTVLFLIWPNVNSDRNLHRRRFINQWIEDDLRGTSKMSVGQEMMSLHFKVVEVLNYHRTDKDKSFSIKNCFT